MKTLYLHIGTPKTGTSSIQSFCHANREALAAQGLSYPVMRSRPGGASPGRNGRFLVDGWTPSATEPAPKPYAQEGLDTLADAFRDFDRVLLSEETLWMKVGEGRDTFWEPLLAHAAEHAYDIRIIVYLRRQDQFAVSWYRQLIKGVWKTDEEMPFEEWLCGPARARLDYRSTLDKIAARMSTDSIDVRIYDRSALDRAGGIYRDILSLAGVTVDDTFEMPDRDVNIYSLTPNFTEIKRLVDTAPAYRPALAAPFTRAAQICSRTASAGGERPQTKIPATGEGDGERPQTKIPATGGGDGERPQTKIPATGEGEPQAVSLLSTDETAALLERFSEGNDAIARDYLHRDGPLFDMTVAETVKWDVSNPQMADDVVRYFCRVNQLQNHRLRELGATCWAGIFRRSGSSNEDGDGMSRPDAPVPPGADDTRRACVLLADFFCKRQAAIDAAASTPPTEDASALPLIQEQRVRSCAIALLAGRGRLTVMRMLGTCALTARAKSLVKAARPSPCAENQRLGSTAPVKSPVKRTRP